MAFRAGEVTFHCPKCGWPVTLRVHVVDVSAHEPLANGDVVIQAEVRAIQLEHHRCGPPPGDGREPIERFVKDGQLDDPTLRR